MARHEHQREDILREATALVERAELSVAGFAEPVVVGFRRNGAGSVFFGADPVYQFDSRRRLRRAYERGRLFKAERALLVEMTRRRTESEVQLVRRVLNEAELRQFLGRMKDRLAMLRDVGQEGAVSVVAQIPPDGEVATHIAVWLELLLGGPIQIAHVPHAR